MHRRDLLRTGALGTALIAASCVTPAPDEDDDGPYGPLAPPDAHGLQLPSGFRSRVVARSSEQVAGTGYSWHLAPDGGACFPAPDGGWAYVSNSEVPFFLGGGASAIAFAPDGGVRAAYRILGGTTQNCAGGPTPWGTWLSCEEDPLGRVWECDPLRPGQGEVRPALGRFTHEAVAVDPVHGHVYLTEDEPDGRLYRFRPARYPDLSTGVLEAAIVSYGRVTWTGPLDPDAIQMWARPPGTRVFAGGEGCWYDAGTVYFTTKGDNRVWALDTDRQIVRVLHRPEQLPESPLRGVDNVTVSPRGDVLVAEDGGNQELVIITPDGVVCPLLRLVGHEESEITGPAFSPDGTRLCFSSQRGTSGERSGSGGTTFEVTGPFSV